ELELALRRRNPGFGPPKLAAYMDRLFERERAELRERLAAYDRAAQRGDGANPHSSGADGVSGRSSLPFASTPGAGEVLARPKPASRTPLVAALAVAAVV